LCPLYVTGGILGWAGLRAIFTHLIGFAMQYQQQSITDAQIQFACPGLLFSVCVRDGFNSESVRGSILSDSDARK